jgi:hypothetical protein
MRCTYDTSYRPLGASMSIRAYTPKKHYEKGSVWRNFARQEGIFVATASPPPANFTKNRHYCRARDTAILSFCQLHFISVGVINRRSRRSGV